MLYMASRFKDAKKKPENFASTTSPQRGKIISEDQSDLYVLAISRDLYIFILQLVFIRVNIYNPRVFQKEEKSSA